jgi:3',5'-cyclic AMP phosphodiesterase CpdA
MPEVKKETPTDNPEDTVHRGPSPAPDSFVLAHVSDLHLTSLDNTTLSQLLNKRMLGYLSWWRKRRYVHRPEIVEALLADLKTIQPDHIAITGDLTHLGLPDEFAEAGRWLARLGPPDQVTVIPGNHEAYVGQKWGDQLQAWAAYLKSDDNQESRKNKGFFPSLRLRGPVALFGLCSARPSLPFLAVGSLDQRQLDRLAKLLQTTGDAGLLRVVLVHHPPVPGTIKWRKRLDNSNLFTELIARCGAELVLHGHTHAPTYSEIRTLAGGVPVVGAPSASELNQHSNRCASYNLYVIERNGESWQLKMRVRSYSEVSGCFQEKQETKLMLPRF